MRKSRKTREMITWMVAMVMFSHFYPVSLLQMVFHGLFCFNPKVRKLVPNSTPSLFCDVINLQSIPPRATARAPKKTMALVLNREKKCWTRSREFVGPRIVEDSKTLTRRQRDDVFVSFETFSLHQQQQPTTTTVSNGGKRCK